MTLQRIGTAFCLTVLAGLPVLAGAAAPVALPSAPQVTGSITSSILGSLAATSSKNLSFGVLVRPTNLQGAGTVTVTTAGVGSLTGTGAILTSSSVSQARFTITGEGQAGISVTVPSSVTLASGSNSLSVTLVNDLVGGATSQTLGGTAGSDGTLVVNVGGSFALSNTTARGAYTGSISLSASYN